MLPLYVLRLKDKYDTQTVRYLAFVLAWKNFISWIIQQIA